MKIIPFDPSLRERWERFWANAPGATFHHARQFLEYHGDRFEDLSLLCEDDKGKILAVLPGARAPDDAETLVCHPGATMGGILFRRNCLPGTCLAVAAGFLGFYKEQGLKRLVYKTTPPHLAGQPNQLDQYVLWRLGARLAGMDQWSVIDLGLPRHVRRDRRSAFRRAQTHALTAAAETGAEAYEAFHCILSENLSRRYGVEPVHSLAEMMDLAERFANDTALWLVRNGAGEPVGGTWILSHRPDVRHTQYIATNQEGREKYAVDLLIFAALEAAETAGARFFSFGANSVDQGRDLNENLFEFKDGFGGGTVAHLFFEIDLETWKAPAKT